MNNEKIVLFARLKVKPGAENEAKRAALAIVADSRAEAGCLNYDMHQVTDNPTMFIWHETWTGEDAIREHANSEHFKAFSAAIKDLTEEPLEVTLTKMVSEKPFIG